MNWIIQLYQQHPYSASIISTWVFNNVVTVLISNLPAPTKDSSVRYVYLFKVLNNIIGNIQRAKSSNVENSPNWQDAIDKHVQQSTPSAGGN